MLLQWLAVINLKYQMQQPHKSLLRQISKIYPPQISQACGRIILYNPLEQWVESHSTSSLQDLIEIQAYSQPLFLSNCSEEVILQNNYEIFLEETASEWMKTVKKKLGSQKKIESETVKVNGGYLNINQSGSINVWKTAQEQSAEDNLYNPESLKNVQQKETQLPICMNTSINPERLVKEYRHGYSFSPILLEDQHIYSLHEFQSDEGNCYKKILRTQITDQEGESSFYNCSLPSKMRKMLTFDRNLCVYGGSDALMVDYRSQSIVCNFNNAEQTEINSVAKAESNSNVFYLARNNEILLLDVRNASELLPIDLKFDEQIDSFELFTQNKKSYCCVSFKIDNKIALTKI